MVVDSLLHGSFYSIHYILRFLWQHFAHPSAIFFTYTIYWLSTCSRHEYSKNIRQLILNNTQAIMTVLHLYTGSCVRDRISIWQASRIVVAVHKTEIIIFIFGVYLYWAEMLVFHFNQLSHDNGYRISAGTFGFLIFGSANWQTRVFP